MLAGSELSPRNNQKLRTVDKKKDIKLDDEEV
jgi:hypothetical protein